ncbi:unnamed protein product [Angiostrongylus costaricensis]|uniref:G_PROTEIN_RECEP_F1_2 domain-containing protein n=1 Tax=Angiostrongylus costaricensis TaxID=334426 RepID=A0A158PCZ4_ANGCS|nr:unnamed protein product [Angiostrongylus costaricensis]
MLSNGSVEDEMDPLCAQYETYTTVRFIFITIATVIACLGTAGNLLLMYIFAAKKTKITPATLYPTLLAFLDFAICLEYLLLFGVDAAVSFLRIESLFLLYYMYIIPAYVASRITQLAIPYMLIFATVERLVWTSGKMSKKLGTVAVRGFWSPMTIVQPLVLDFVHICSRSRFLLAMNSTSGRYFTAIISLLVCVILRLPTAFATEVAVYPQCEDFFRTMTTQPRTWTYDSEIYYFFDFHLMTIAQTVVPFVILLALNIVRFTFLQFFPYLTLSIRSMKKVSASVRCAIMTMVAIVASYLISNTLHLILTVMERSDHPLLHDTEDPLLSSTFHTFFSDSVSFVYMFTSAIRILIYFFCNPVIRSDIRNFFYTNGEVNL